MIEPYVGRRLGYNSRPFNELTGKFFAKRKGRVAERVVELTAEMVLAELRNAKLLMLTLASAVYQGSGNGQTAGAAQSARSVAVTGDTGTGPSCRASCSTLRRHGARGSAELDQSARNLGADAGPSTCYRCPAD